MPRSITLYVDGSAGYVSGGKFNHFELAWGIRAHYDGTTEESLGSREVPQRAHGMHEKVAFVEGMLLALARGFAFEDMVFFTDDDVLPYGGMYLHPENGMGTRREQLEQRMLTLCRLLYTQDLYDKVIECLKRSRFHKVRGHSFVVDHDRVDYLAKVGLRRGLRGDTTPMLGFSDWLTQGVEYRRSADDRRTWFAPFVTTLGAGQNAGHAH